MRPRVGTQRSGSHRSEDASSKGRIIQGKHHPRDASSKGRIIQWMHHPRDGSSKGWIIQGMDHPKDASSKEFITQGMHHQRDASSKACIIQRTHHPRAERSGTFVRGHIGQGHIVMTFYNLQFTHVYKFGITYVHIVNGIADSHLASLHILNVDNSNIT
jgi:hypothetical protein